MTADNMSMDEMLAMATGMDIAMAVAKQAGTVITPEMTAKHAAELTRNVIVAAIQEHANATRRSAYDRGQEPEGGDDAAA